MYDDGMDGMDGRWMVDVARVFVGTVCWYCIVLQRRLLLPRLTAKHSIHQILSPHSLLECHQKQLRVLAATTFSHSEVINAI